MDKFVFKNILKILKIFRHFRNEKELEPKRVLQLFLGSLIGTCWAAIGQFFSLALVTVPEVLAKVDSIQFPSGL